MLSLGDARSSTARASRRRTGSGSARTGSRFGSLHPRPATLRAREGIPRARSTSSPPVSPRLPVTDRLTAARLGDHRLDRPRPRHPASNDGPHPRPTGPPPGRTRLPSWAHVDRGIFGPLHYSTALDTCAPDDRDALDCPSHEGGRVGPVKNLRLPPASRRPGLRPTGAVGRELAHCRPGGQGAGQIARRRSCSAVLNLAGRRVGLARCAPDLAAPQPDPVDRARRGGRDRAPRRRAGRPSFAP